MFYIIGLGLCDEKDITVRGLEVLAHSLTPCRLLTDFQAVKGATRVYLEAYTSILMVQKERLVCDQAKCRLDSLSHPRGQAQEAFYEKQLILADRDMVETQSDEILHRADELDVALLVVGDPFG